MTGLYWGASEAARSERLAAYIRGTYPIRKNGEKGEPYGVVQHQNQRGRCIPSEVGARTPREINLIDIEARDVQEAKSKLFDAWRARYGGDPPSAPIGVSYPH